MRFPGLLRSFAAWAISFYDPIFAHLLTQSRHKAVSEVYDYVAEKLEYERLYRKFAWEENKFDAIIAPVQAIPAVPHQYVCPLLRQTYWLMHLAAAVTTYPLWHHPLRSSTLSIAQWASYP